MNTNVGSAIHVSCLPNYDRIDSGRGRCRISPSSTLLSRLPTLRIGRVLRLRIFDPESTRSIDILCTVWPDSDNVLSGNEIAVDDSIVVGERFRWTYLSCQVIEVVPSRHASSVKFLAPVDTRLKLPVGLPVIPGCSVLVENQTIPILASNPNTCCVLSHMTIYLPQKSTLPKAELNEASKSSSSSSSTESIAQTSLARTKVVNEIIMKMVLPILSPQPLPPFALFRGFMLLGPPGVGKSFAVQAVKMLFRDIIPIDIVQVSIPDLLSSEDPSLLLQQLLPSISISTSQSRRSTKNTAAHAPNGNAVVQTPSRASNSSTPVGKSSTSRTTVSSSATSTPQSQTKFSFLSPMSQVSSPIKTSASASAIATKQQEQQPLPRKKRLIFLLVDEIDALGHVHNQSETQLALKAILCQWLDSLQNQQDYRASFDENNDDGEDRHYSMIATSNRSEDVDVCFRRGGRLEQEINVLVTKDDRRLLLQSYYVSMVASLQHHMQRHQQQQRTTSTNLGTFPRLPHQGIIDFLLSHPLHAQPQSESKGIHDELQEVVEALDVLAESTGGYVAADIASLFGEVQRRLLLPVQAEHGENQFTNNPATLHDEADAIVVGGVVVKDVTKPSAMKNFLAVVLEAMRAVPPSCLRGITVSLPQLTLSDVIGHTDAKQQLQRVVSFTQPSMQAKLRRFQLHTGLGGVILYGPPGNSKTRLVSAVAASCHLPLIALSAADVYSAYVGDAEAEVRKAFTIARQAAPCILFFDELDSLVTNRAHSSSSSSSSSSVELRVLSTFLNEMDGIAHASAAAAGVVVMAATNRLDCIDAALLRKGRFYQSVYVAPPNEMERWQLLQYFGGVKAQLSEETLRELEKTRLYEGMSGAEVETVCKEAAVAVIRQQQQLLQQVAMQQVASP